MFIAGNASFKVDLFETDILSQNLKARVAQLIDVAYGGENGLSQAIDISEEKLVALKFMGQKSKVSTFMREVAIGSRSVCYGIKDCMAALESGALKELIVDEELDYYRVILRKTEGETPGKN